MSQYTHIFVRENDTFVELNCFSRSNEIAQAFRGAPYEKIEGYSSINLAAIRDEVREKANGYREAIKNYREKIALVPSFNNSVEDKMSALNEYDELIKEAEDELDELNYAENILTFLVGVADEYEMNVKYEGAKDQPRIYVGVECGSNVTVNDILG